jgi:hypothetical protein
MSFRVLLWTLVAAAPQTAADRLPATLPPGSYTPRVESHTLSMPAERARDLREDAFSRATVWHEPALPVGKADLLNNPPGEGSFEINDEVACKFLLKPVGGTSPKFECVLQDGRVLRVKYGPNPEVQTEVAATRLLEALGFGADRVYAVKRVRCFGCPEDPYTLLTCISSPSALVKKDCVRRWGKEGPTGEIEISIDYGKYSDFDNVAIEQRLKGQAIVAGKSEGWAWSELDKIDAARGGATEAERDALRLMAVVLNQWDNRSDNQRLLCLPGGASPANDGSCSAPFAFMHDVGATFGRVGVGGKDERKLDLEAWRSVRIWKEDATCLVEIESPALHGATFEEVRISEAGRRFLANLVGQLEEQQMRALFVGARFPADERHWAAALRDKVSQIVERPPCPAGP